MKPLFTVLAAAKEDVISGVTAGFAVVVTAFIQDSIERMIPWLLVGVAVIVCDLIVGIRRSIAAGEKIRPSRAIRNTMGKIVTYFSFVAMVCMVNTATGGEHHAVEKWACLLVYGVEFVSIIGNLFHIKGYSINWNKLTGALLGKAFGGNKSDYEDIITKEHEDSKNEVAEKD